MSLRLDNPVYDSKNVRCEWCKKFIPRKQMIFHSILCSKQPPTNGG